MTDRADPKIRQALGLRLRALRKQHGLSQERLGERAGLSGKFIGEVERGEKSISIDSLYPVSVALETPLSALLDFLKGPTSAELEATLALVRSLKPRTARKVYRVVRALVAAA